MQTDLTNVYDDESESFCQNSDFNVTDSIYFELDNSVTISDVETVIRSLKCNKAFAADQLSNGYFIETLDIFHHTSLIFLMPF